MNFAQIHKEALQRGIEQATPEVKQLSGAEQKVQSIHNEWLKHQDTKELVNYCQTQQKKFLEQAQTLASSSDPEDNKIRACLCKAQGINIIIKYISNYGEFNINRDSGGE